ncbi:unnamed protein product [Ceratitis capitata]|uniref:(Mediterranean fruit fly) hypothetical protein n=1 Tax=Ceratitis capitata TaxID=7213 RepID=A0A811UIT0_CERCA|nr:unnamed protein product [Ceratitis capitata]
MFNAPKIKSGNQGRADAEQIMVEPAPFDIYLCDNCDAELYSKEAILEHEKTCNVEDDDDDVILCDTPEPLENTIQPTDSKGIQRTMSFVIYSYLILTCNVVMICIKDAKDDKSGFMIIDKNKRMPRRNRAVHSLARCATIPLSSPAGQLLLRTTKNCHDTGIFNRTSRSLGTFCFAPLLSKSQSKPKYFEKKHTFNNTHCTFKKPQEYSSHVYVFPRRQFSQRRRTESFLFLNSSLIRRCRPISVRLKKITDNEVKSRRSLPNTKLNIKLTRDATRRSNWKISSPSTEIIVDTIDLCSSDEDEGRSNSESRTQVMLHRRSEPGTGLEITRRLINTCSSNNNATSTSAKSSLTISSGGIKQLSLNTTEVSIFPIRKSARNNGPVKGPDKPQIKSAIAAALVSNPRMSSATKSTSLVVNNSLTSATVAAINTPAIQATESTKTSTIGINALLTAPTTAAIFSTPEHGITLPKPLQPSVYIFSNYTANTLTPTTATTATVPTNNEITGPVAGNSFRNQNQENRAQNGAHTNTNASAGLVVKHQISNSNTATPPMITPDWYPELNTLGTSSAAATLNNAKQTTTHLAERERARSLSLVSPSRVISIDLTS